MLPAGYISLMEAANILKRTTTQVRADAAAAGLRYFMFKGGHIYKKEDFERLKARLGVSEPEADAEPLAPTGRNVAGGGSAVEEIDLDELFAGQKGGSMDSGLFDNTGLSDSGLFESRHTPKPGTASPTEPPRPPNNPGGPTRG